MRRKFRGMILAILCLCMYPSLLVDAADGEEQTYKKYVIGVKEIIELDYGDIDPEACIWTSSDAQIAYPRDNGKVVGNEIGTTTIQCCDLEENPLRTYKIVVKAAPKKIILKTTKIAEFPKQEIKLEPKVNSGAVCSKFKCKSSNTKVASVSAKGVVKTKSKGNAKITISTYNGVSKKVEVRVKDPKKAIAFTFDDGPAGNNTKKVLDVLEKYDYHATFFMTGNRINSDNKKLLKRMVKNGNEIGTHSWEHKMLPRLSKDSLRRDLKKSKSAIYDACGQNPTVMRPPGGAVNATVLEVCKELKLPVVIWNNDTNDWRAKNKNAATVKRIILNSASSGEVVLLHDLHQTSVDGFVSAVPELKKRGYELVTVSELARLHGDKLQPGKKFFGY